MKKGDVPVAWNGQAKGLEYPCLAGTGIEKVFSPEDFGDAREGIINGAGELIGKESIGALDDKVSAQGIEIDGDPA